MRPQSQALLSNCALVFRSNNLERRFITHNPELLDLITPQMDADLAAKESPAQRH
ncbi:MAG TPA: hypothetical protein VGD78_02565 [Chthoniobacterales bacterium]